MQKRQPENKTKGTLYRVAKTLSGELRDTFTPVRKQNGKLVSSTKDELTCWKNRVERVLNQECPTTVAEIGEGVDTLSIDTEVPTVEEVK